MVEKEKKERYVDFIVSQLSEMAKTINKNSSKNQSKRGNNPFLIFKDDNAKKFMGMGRSLDSQLGTRLQHIALFAARCKFGDANVPNVIILFGQNGQLKMSTLSYDLSMGMSQKVYWYNGDVFDKVPKTVKKAYEKDSSSFEKLDFTIKTSDVVIETVKKEFSERDTKSNGIPIDLFYLLRDKAGELSETYCYEVKAGGNLDTKNAPSNAKEVKSDKKIFAFCPHSVSKFATCYDGKGDGTPDGSIGNSLSPDEIVIGEKFWIEVLENDISYDDFIKIYQEAYKKAEVEKILVG